MEQLLPKIRQSEYFALLDNSLKNNFSDISLKLSDILNKSICV